ncbi:triose-phosphate isomerase [Candidatus Falkowbacteria bacterium]|nr:triose-phosphate isomerase [Candidatus Falkowbacteria bacterium]
MSKLIIANWKMNMSAKAAMNFIPKIIKSKNLVAVAAPYTYLKRLQNKLPKYIKLSGQDVSVYESGSKTGDISAKMLKETGCAYCIVGHSERRIFKHETDKEINDKILNLLKVKIIPVLCVGENISQKRLGQTNKVLSKQLDGALNNIKKPGNFVIAYEPVWAITTFQKGKIKKSASVQDIKLAHVFIKQWLNKHFGREGKKIMVLYGGTVNPKNSFDILKLKEVDGALVGAASLKVSSFNAIIKFN